MRPIMISTHSVAEEASKVVEHVWRATNIAMRIIAFTDSDVPKNKGLRPAENITVILIVGSWCKPVEIAKLNLLRSHCVVIKGVSIPYPLNDLRIEAHNRAVPILIRH